MLYRRLILDLLYFPMRMDRGLPEYLDSLRRFCFQIDGQSCTPNVEWSSIRFSSGGCIR